MKTFQQWLETRMDGMPIGRENSWFGCRKCGERTEETRKNMISRLCDKCDKKTQIKEPVKEFKCSRCGKPAEVFTHPPVCKACKIKG